MKKILLILQLVLVFVVFTACGSENSKTEQYLDSILELDESEIIDVKMDGSFALYKYYHDITKWSTTNNETFEGTYSVNDDIVTLHYNNEDHILLIVGEKLYFDVIQKVE